MWEGGRKEGTRERKERNFNRGYIFTSNSRNMMMMPPPPPPPIHGSFCFSSLFCQPEKVCWQVQSTEMSKKLPPPPHAYTNIINKHTVHTKHESKKKRVFIKSHTRNTCFWHKIQHSLVPSKSGGQS